MYTRPPPFAQYEFVTSRRSYCCAVHVLIYFLLSPLKVLLLFFFHHIELNQLDEYFLYCWCCYCCVSCYLYFVRFIFVSLFPLSFVGVLMSPVFLNTYLPSHTLVTVGPLRYEMLVFPIHLSFIFISPRCALCVWALFPFESPAQREYQVKRPTLQWQLYIYGIIINFVFSVVVVVPRVISAFKERAKKGRRSIYSTLHFVHLHSPLLVSILYPY